MSKWKNKNDYYVSLDNLHNNAKIELEKLQLSGRVFEGEEDKYLHYVKRNADTRHLILVKEELSDELFNHINSYTLDLDLVDLQMIISCIGDLDYFKKSKMSTDGNEFTRETDKLKKDADKIQFYSEQAIRIKLPILPHITKRLLYDYFLDRGVIKKAEIKDIFRFFGLNGRVNLPRNDFPIAKELYNTYHNLGNYIIKDMQDGVEYTEDTVLSAVLEETEYYTPDIKYSYYISKTKKILKMTQVEASLEEKFMATFGSKPEEILSTLIK